MTALATKLKEFETSVRASEEREVRRLFNELDLALFREEMLAPELFQQIATLVGDPEFRRAEPSWKLLTLLTGHWELLSRTQIDQLRQVLVAAFDGFGDSTGAFVSAEILAQQYGDKRALDDLVRLGSVAALPARALVPHGLETLARETTDQKLRSAAVEELKRLAQSDNEDVRCEALTSLAKATGGTGGKGG